jgi:hypothetical protein
MLTINSQFFKNEQLRRTMSQKDGKSLISNPNRAFEELYEKAKMTE